MRRQCGEIEENWKHDVELEEGKFRKLLFRVILDLRIVKGCDEFERSQEKSEEKNCEEGE